jgi:hypothetical protein
MKIEFEFFDSHLVYTKQVTVRIDDPEVEENDDEEGCYYATIEVPLKTPKMFVRAVLWISEWSGDPFIHSGIYMDDNGYRWHVGQTGERTKLMSITDYPENGFKIPKKFVLIAQAMAEGR